MTFLLSTPGIYLTITMGMTSMSIILTVFVLQLHHVGPHKRPVPSWIHTIVVGVFARLVCMSRDSQSYRQYRLAPATPRSGHSVSVRVEPELGTPSPGLRRNSFFASDVRCIENQSGYTTEGRTRDRNEDLGRFSDRASRDNGRESIDYVEEALSSIRRSQNTSGFSRGRPNCNGEGFVQQLTPCASTRRPNEMDPCYSPLIPHSQSMLLPPASTAASQSSASCPFGQDQGQPLTFGDGYGQRRDSMQNSPKPRLSFMQAGVIPQSGCMEGPTLERYQQLVLEWQFVAVVMDRVLFWFFLFLAIVFSMSILVIKPLFKPEL